MNRRTALLLSAAVFASASAPQFACAQSPPFLEVNRTRIVNRIYLATYGTHEVCRVANPGDTVRVDAAIARFRATYSELAGLVDTSPYFAGVREHYAAELKDNAERRGHAALVDDCTALERALAQMLDAPGAGDEMRDLADTMKR